MRNASDGWLLSVITEFNWGVLEIIKQNNKVYCSHVLACLSISAWHGGGVLKERPCLLSSASLTPCRGHIGAVQWTSDWSMRAKINDSNFGIITVLLFLLDARCAGAGYVSRLLLNLDSKRGQIFSVESYLTICYGRLFTCMLKKRASSHALF